MEELVALMMLRRTTDQLIDDTGHAHWYGLDATVAQLKDDLLIAASSGVSGVSTAPKESNQELFRCADGTVIKVDLTRFV